MRGKIWRSGQEMSGKREGGKEDEGTKEAGWQPDRVRERVRVWRDTGRDGENKWVQK